MQRMVPGQDVRVLETEAMNFKRKRCKRFGRGAYMWVERIGNSRKDTTRKQRRLDARTKEAHHG